MSKKIRSREWTNYGRWVQPTLSACFWCHAYRTNGVREFVGKQQFAPIMMLDGNTFVHVRNERMVKNVVQRVCKNAHTMRVMMRRLDRVGEKYTRKHLQVLQSKQHGEAYLCLLFDTYREVVGLWWFSIHLGDELQDFALSQRRFKTAEDLLQRVEAVRKRTWLEEQNVEVSRFAQRIKTLRPRIKARDITERLLRELSLYNRMMLHVAKYRWFGTHHWTGQPYSVKKCVVQIREILKKNPIKHEGRGRRPTHDAFVQLLATVAYWRTHCAEVTVKAVYGSRRELTSSARHVGLSYDRFVYLSSDEVLRLLRGSSRIPENLRKREQALGCSLDQNGRERVIVGKPLRTLLRNLMSAPTTASTTLHGMVANRGALVHGVVRILISPKDFSGFKRGNILVAPETTPDFVQYMKQASAIVTDRGGVTSHAAIVSRELGIPCIIGTRYASQVLKNGMRVEVDTGRGIVRVLS